MLIRSLSEEGLSLFQEHIMGLRSGAAVPTPKWLLDDERTSIAIDLSVDLDNLDFSSRYEMGVYLSESLKSRDVQPLIGSRSFWSWLGLFWFDQFCPADGNGTRKPSMPYNYVLSDDYKHRSRHAVFITWQLVTRYGEAARFLLCGDMSRRGELIEQMMARQDILSLEGVMKLASRLYSDERSGKFKRGAAARDSRGCVSRYVTWLQQLELTYDLYSISADELEDLLPKEFDRFRTKQAAAG